MVLNVFASWCQPCKAEAPVLDQEQRALANHNATILGVTYLDNSTASEQFVRQEHITYPVLRDVSGNFVRSFGTTGCPRPSSSTARDGSGAAPLSAQQHVAEADAALDPGRALVITRRLRAVLAGLALAAVTLAPLVPAQPLLPRALPHRRQNDVMCVACHEPLAVAQSPEAFSERAYIRQLIAQGMTKTQIEKELVAQYGEAVLAKPPARGFNLVIYILPPAVLLIGLATLAYTLPKWRRRTRETPPGGHALPRPWTPLAPRTTAPVWTTSSGARTADLRRPATSNPAPLTPADRATARSLLRGHSTARSGTIPPTPERHPPPCSRGRRR